MLEYHIDFHGQSLAEQIIQGIVSAFAVLGFIVGFVLQDILATLYVFAAGIVLAALLVIPAWPYFRKNPIKWLPSREKLTAAASKQQEVAQGKKKAA